MQFPRRWLVHGLWLAAALGCSWWRPSASGGNATQRTGSSPRIVQHDVDQRPKLVALVRQGDPEAALALAVGPLATVEESSQLAALLRTRLAHSPQRFDVLPRLGGVAVLASIGPPATAHQVIVQLDQALRTKVSSEELARADYQGHLQQMRSLAAFQISDAERALCLQETTHGIPNGGGVEQVRQRVFAEDRARWGVVGTRDVIDAVGVAVRHLDAWPRGNASVALVPAQDRSSFVHTGNRLPHLDVAWWAPTIAQSLAARRELESGASTLREVLSALPATGRLDRVTVSPLSLGSCVGLSLSLDGPGVAAATEELIAAARVSVGLLRRFARQSSPEEASALAVIEQSDPRIAAELAAQLSLGRDAKTGVDRFGIALDVGSEGAVPTAAQQRAVWPTAAGPESLPILRAAEHGQGRLYALIASPCATWSESGRTVGSTSLLLRMLAKRYHEVQNVTVEPWITADGVGLIAHNSRQSVQETPEEQARRLGDALGRVLVVQRLEASDLWNVRTSLLAQIGPGPRPALWRALLALSPHSPGLVAPDGQFSSVETVPLATLQERRAELLRLPLRLAVIENESAKQGDVLRLALSEWISLFRFETVQCPEQGSGEPLRAGETRIESRDPDPNDAGSTLVIPLPAQEPLAEAHAILLQWLLGRPSGWLAERMRSGDIVASVDAKVVGGMQRRGLVVVIAAPPSSLDVAATSVKALLQELGTGTLPSSPSIASAIAEVQLTERQRRIVPQVRLEELWTARRRGGPPSENSFREYLKRVFATPSVLQVRSVRTGVAPVVAGRPKR